MKDLLLKRKGIGILAVLILSLCISVYFANTVKTIVKAYVPVIQQESAAFLPITLQGGEIVEPKNTVITKEYANGMFTVVLNTNIDQFSVDDLKKPGLYIAKKYISTNGNKIEYQSLDKFPDMVIDNELVATVAQYLEQNAGKFLFFICLFISLITIGLIVLIGTVLIHWLMALLFHVNFAHTLRVTTLAYVVVVALSVFAGLSFSTLVNFLILVAANVAVDTAGKA